MIDVRVGKSAVYVSSKGHEKAAIVFATHESLAEDSPLPAPEEGYVHIIIYGMTGLTMAPGAAIGQFYPDVPLKETIQDIPDFKIDGKLVGYVEVF